MMRTPDERSPMSLLQEELCHDPWKMLVACKMLNCTGYKQVRSIIFDFFGRWPTAAAAASADHDEMMNMIRPLGFGNRRATQIIRFSTEYCGDGWSDPSELYGIGKYARDSWTIFVERSLDVDPTDKKLLQYIRWAMSR